METIERPVEKLYSARTIACATFLGGPLAAGYLMAKNYYRLGEEAGKKSFLYGFAATALLLFLIIFFFDESLDSVPNYLLPLAQALLVYWLVKREQGSYFQEHLENGGRKASWLGALGISLVSLVGTLLLIIAMQGYKPDELSKITFGRLEHQVYYNDEDLNRAQVRKVAHVLGDHGFFDRYDRMQILLEQNKWAYKVMVDADPEAFKNSEVIQYLKNIQSGLDTVQFDKRIQLVLYYYEGEERVTKNF